MDDATLAAIVVALVFLPLGVVVLAVLFRRRCARTGHQWEQEFGGATFVCRRCFKRRKA